MSDTELLLTHSTILKEKLLNVISKYLNTDSNSDIQEIYQILNEIQNFEFAIIKEIKLQKSINKNLSDGLKELISEIFNLNNTVQTLKISCNTRLALCQIIQTDNKLNNPTEASIHPIINEKLAKIIEIHRKKEPIKCIYCGLLNHKEKNCRFKKRNENNFIGSDRSTFNTNYHSNNFFTHY